MNIQKNEPHGISIRNSKSFSSHVENVTNPNING
jgi:hypothetical protein